MIERRGLGESGREVLGCMQYLYSRVERKKIINAIKYSKINQQQQTLIKNIVAQDVLLFLMVPNLIQAVKGLHFPQNAIC